MRQADADAIRKFHDHLAVIRRLPDTTVGSYVRTVRLVSAWLQIHENVALLTAERHHIRNWRKTLTNAETTVMAYMSHVRAFYRWAILDEVVARDPTFGIPMPKQPKRIPRPIAEDPLEEAIATAPERIRPWLVLAGYAGLRACEIASLHRSRIFETAPAPYMIVKGKGGKERTIPLSPYLWQELRPHMRRGFLFWKVDGSAPVNRQIVSQQCNKHLRACGLDDTLHQLRHRFGTVLQREVKNVRVTQDLMGHDSLKSTQIYTQVAPEDAVAGMLAVQPKRMLRALPQSSASGS